MTPLAQHHHLHHQSLRTHMNCKQRREEPWLLAKYKVIMKRPCKGQMALGKSKGHFILTKLLFCRFSQNCRQKILKTTCCLSTGTPLSKSNSYQDKDKALFTTVLRQITIHATVPVANFSKNAATFGKSKMQLSNADNQLSRQEASPFTNFNAQLCTQGL